MIMYKNSNKTIDFVIESIIILHNIYFIVKVYTYNMENLYYTENYDYLVIFLTRFISTINFKQRSYIWRMKLLS